MSVQAAAHGAPVGVAGLPQLRRRPRHSADDFVRHAISVCEREGAAAITARRIAKDMDLSPMALYRHFRGMDHLLAVVWNEGFAQLLALMNLTSESRGGGTPGFRAALRAYVQFGISNPGLYRFMFTSGARPESFGIENLGLTAMGRLREHIQALVEAGEIRLTQDEQVASLLIWFLLHGLTTVAISGQLQKVTDLDLDDLVEGTTAHIFQSL